MYKFTNYINPTLWVESAPVAQCDTKHPSKVLNWVLIKLTFLSESCGGVEEDQEDGGPKVILRTHHHKSIFFTNAVCSLILRSRH